MRMISYVNLVKLIVISALQVFICINSLVMRLVH